MWGRAVGRYGVGGDGDKGVHHGGTESNGDARRTGRAARTARVASTSRETEAVCSEVREIRTPGTAACFDRPRPSRRAPREARAPQPAPPCVSAVQLRASAVKPCPPSPPRQSKNAEHERIQMKRSIVVAITGASGAIYATRTLAALLERGCHIELVVSDYGRRLLRDELGDGAAIDKLMDYLAATYGEGVRAGTYTLHSNKDLGAKIASGSQDCDSMVIVPVLDEDAGRRRARPFAQPGRAGGGRHAQGAPDA